MFGSRRSHSKGLDHAAAIAGGPSSPALEASLRAGDVHAAREALAAGSPADSLIDVTLPNGSRLRTTPLAMAIDLFGKLGALEALPPEPSAEEGIALSIDRREAEALRAGADKPAALALVAELLRAGAHPAQPCFREDRRGLAEDGERPTWLRVFAMPSWSGARHEPSPEDALAVAELLVAAGWPTGSSDASRRTGLHFSARSGFEGVAELLLANGWDPASRDEAGHAPDETALMNGRHELARLLFRAREAAEIAACSAEAASSRKSGRL